MKKVYVVLYIVGIFLFLGYLTFTLGPPENQPERLADNQDGYITIQIGYDTDLEKPYWEGRSELCSDPIWSDENHEWTELYVRSYKNREDAVDIRNKLLQFLNETQ